jgi:hypothetical protein
MVQSASPDVAILEGLRKAVQALPARLPLTGPGGAFPVGVKGKALANSAIDQGYLTSKKEKVKTGSRSKTVEYALITEKGMIHVATADSPKAALEALVPAVQSLGKQPDAPNPQAFRAELAQATESCMNAIRTSFEKLEGQVLKALTPHFARFEGELSQALPVSSPVVDSGSVLRALQHALDRVKSPDLHAAAPAHPTEPPATNPSIVSARGLEEDLVAFVDSWMQEKTVGCQFDVLWNHLKGRHPHLTIGGFQDALRHLYDASRIRLSGWPRMHDDMPQPQLALFISSKVMYYAQPTHPNG